MLTITKGYTRLLYVGLTNSTNANVGPCITNRNVGREISSHVRPRQRGVKLFLFYELRLFLILHNAGLNTCHQIYQ